MSWVERVTKNLESDLDSLWSLLPGDAPTTRPSIIDTSTEHSSANRTKPDEQTEHDQVFSSAFDVDRLAIASAGAAASVAGQPTIDRTRLAPTFSTLTEIDGSPIPKWADLSGYYRTGDERTVQLHCNFPHHRDGVLDALGLSGTDTTRVDVENAIATLGALELETMLLERGMICAMIRSLDEWGHHPHAAATNGLPLISVSRLGDAPARPKRQTRVLDCSRVLAGPVAGQTLAAQGADVLRLGADHLPAVPICVMSTGFGKRNTSVDVRTPSGAATMRALLGDADVWLDAYRPGAFAEHGFSPEGLADDAPGCVVVQLCAFDWDGLWAGRRGFDSIVQSTTGIVDAGTVAAGRGEPTPLPVQALDYATGYFAAAAATHMVNHQRNVGGSWLVRLSLLRTRNHLVSFGGPHTFAPKTPTVDRSVALHTIESTFGELTTSLPLVGSVTAAPSELGTSSAEWIA